MGASLDVVVIAVFTAVMVLLSLGGWVLCCRWKERRRHGCWSSWLEVSERSILDGSEDTLDSPIELAKRRGMTKRARTQRKERA